MKLLWLGYLVYSLGNCVMKLCIETGLIDRLTSSKFDAAIYRGVPSLNDGICSDK